ncbi:PaREP1 family protein [Pyrodictium abyssi]|uniref:PaREP1 family protein n=1 Tax=Pyrodictium abyssi TaxID=54256 RepID=A0ABN6ZUY9_9CREN|nr:PaREP1 family protein [Pyrodictium abyssi]
MAQFARALEKPLPKPEKNLVGYASARVLEALLEGILALEFLKQGYTRSAAGKAFQAWRALTAAILALEKEKLEKHMERNEQRRWLEEVAIPRVPSSKLKPLSRLVEKSGYSYFSLYTDRALDLHDYQLHGPDPSGELSKYPSESDAVEDILSLLQELLRIVTARAKPSLEKAKAWSKSHDEAARQLEEKLAKILQSHTGSSGA